MVELRTDPPERSSHDGPHKPDTEALRHMDVLGVGDDDDARELLGGMLELARCRVRLAASPTEALELLAAWRPDAIVSDVGMPESDGYEFLRKLRALEGAAGRQAPAIALTGYATASHRLAGQEAGFEFYLAKPVEPMVLYASLARVRRL